MVVPNDTPSVKCDAIRAYGAQLVLCEPSPNARHLAAAEIVATRGYHLVHPYDDYRVMAGQGTIALELLEQVSDTI